MNVFAMFRARVEPFFLKLPISRVLSRTVLYSTSLWYEVGPRTRSCCKNSSIEKTA